jgi:hypothetical protein
MTKNKNTCDCELCLFKTFPLDNPLANDSTKIIEAIIYHFIVRLSNLVKSKKELKLQITKFINMINQPYLPFAPLDETINIIYKKIIDSGNYARFSTNTSLTKLMNKEATYLKLIISSMTEEKADDVSLKEEVEVISLVIEDIKTLQKDIEIVIDDINTIKKDIVEDVKPIIVDASGSYYSYCIIS